MRLCATRAGWKDVGSVRQLDTIPEYAHNLICDITMLFFGVKGDWPMRLRPEETRLGARVFPFRHVVRGLHPCMISSLALRYFSLR